MRRLVLIGKHRVKLVRSQSTRDGALTDSITEALEFLDIKAAQTFVFPRRHHDRHIALLAPDSHWLSLRGVQYRGKPLLGFRG
jgi:hypothetical protein